MRTKLQVAVFAWTTSVCVPAVFLAAASSACSSDDSGSASDGGAESAIPSVEASDVTQPADAGVDATIGDEGLPDGTVADGTLDGGAADVTETSEASSGGEAGGPGAEGGPDGDAGPPGETGPDGEAGPQGGICTLAGGWDGGATTASVLAALGGPACLQCALDNYCIDPDAAGLPGGEDLTGVSEAGSPASGVLRSSLCMATLRCLMCTDCFQNDNVNQCFCGTDAGCTTANAMGPCKTQEENGFETADADVILYTYGDTTTGSGVANGTVECLYFSCPQCWADGGP